MGQEGDASAFKAFLRHSPTPRHAFSKSFQTLLNEGMEENETNCTIIGHLYAKRHNFQVC